VSSALVPVCYRKSVPGTTKHTGCSRSPTHTSTRACGGRSGVANCKLGTVLGE
jgi:hypothetical protein